MLEREAGIRSLAGRPVADIHNPLVQIHNHRDEGRVMLLRRLLGVNMEADRLGLARVVAQGCPKILDHQGLHPLGE